MATRLPNAAELAPWYQAMEQKDVPALQKLLEGDKGPERFAYWQQLRFQTPAGYWVTPLIWACSEGCASVVQWLLSNGTPVSPVEKGPAALSALDALKTCLSTGSFVCASPPSEEVLAKRLECLPWVLPQAVIGSHHCANLASAPPAAAQQLLQELTVRGQKPEGVVWLNAIETGNVALLRALLDLERGDPLPLGGYGEGRSRYTLLGHAIWISATDEIIAELCNYFPDLSLAVDAAGIPLPAEKVPLSGKQRDLAAALIEQRKLEQHAPAAAFPKARL